MKTKTCIECKLIKDVVNFRVTLLSKDSYRNKCKQCSNTHSAGKARTPEAKERRNQLTREHAKNDKDYYRRLNILGHYKLKWVDYLKLLEQQSNRCAICKNLPSGQTKKTSTLYVDHCHVTNRVRGLLCHACNMLLGHAKDNTQVLQSAITYLQEPAIVDES
jgi:hypothetical protein